MTATWILFWDQDKDIAEQSFACMWVCVCCAFASFSAVCILGLSLFPQMSETVTGTFFRPQSEKLEFKISKQGYFVCRIHAERSLLRGSTSKM